MCQTGGPRSSPSHKAALGTEETGKKPTTSLHVLLWHHMDNWTQAMRNDAFTGSFTAGVSPPRELAPHIYYRGCVYGVKHCKGAEREGRHPKLSPESNKRPSPAVCASATSRGFAHTRLTGDLYAQRPAENCLLRDAAVINAACV